MDIQFLYPMLRYLPCISWPPPHNKGTEVWCLIMSLWRWWNSPGSKTQCSPGPLAPGCPLPLWRPEGCHTGVHCAPGTALPLTLPGRQDKKQNVLDKQTIGDRPATLEPWYWQTGQKESLLTQVMGINDGSYTGIVSELTDHDKNPDGWTERKEQSS